MSCQTCDAILYPYYSEEISTARLYCRDCLEIAQTLSLMSEAPKKQQKAPRDGMTIENMLIRIHGHRRFQNLSEGIRQQLGQIGRFDRRRSTDDNNYVRDVWHFLENGVVLHGQ